MVVANRGGILSSVDNGYQWKLLLYNDLTDSAKKGTSLASTPSLAIGGASPALRLPITAAAVGLIIPMTSAHKGFTLIELLIVVVIIGILAAIAIPKFEHTKGKAQVSAIKSDLRNLMSAQESYYYDYQTYAGTTTQLSVQPTKGVILQIFDADNKGWAATATHPQAFPLTCGVFVAGAPQRAPADIEGLIGCK